MEDLAYHLCTIAQRAGEKIKEIRLTFSDEDFQIKGDGSPVTIADLKAHEAIIEALSLLRPEWPIVSEEGSSGGDPLDSEYSFLVDPLDGTKEFIRGNGMYTVNIAVMALRGNGRWEPMLGVVHAPESTSTWFGGVGVPATLQDEEGIRTISSGSDRSKPVIVGSVSHSSPKDLEFAESIGEHVFEGVGSSLKICRVADGSADLAPRFGTTSCWDTAAAHAVLNAAGGSLVDPSGRELDYDIKEEILNPWFLATSGGLGVDQWKSHQGP
jgi:3'(2'), 5'-bisphosphate nucleotidase